LKKAKFSIAHQDPEMWALIGKTSHLTLAVWAIDCAKRVMPYFERRYPEDQRPRQALKALEAWIRTGEFKMAIIRGASLASHSAAREVGEDNAARSAARAAGQTAATAHVPRHSYGSAIYAQQAVFRAANSSEAEAAALRERDWQYRHLLELAEKSA
jgi:hypothetical protein